MAGLITSRPNANTEKQLDFIILCRADFRLRPAGEEATEKEPEKNSRIYYESNNLGGVF